jgi:predicted nucleic acid-binding protein
MAAPFLLDTAVLLHWIRDKSQAAEIDRQFNLATSPLRPLMCEVSLGELLAFSQNRQWGDRQRKRLQEVERRVTTVDISDRRVIEAYADLSTLARNSGWAIFNGKNDLWVGAAAKVTQAHLLTMDTDFQPLRGLPGWRVTVLDAHTALPVP